MATRVLSVLQPPTTLKNWSSSAERNCCLTQVSPGSLITRASPQSVRTQQTLATNKRPRAVVMSSALPAAQKGPPDTGGREEGEEPVGKPRVKGKTVVITGGSQGTGRETARLFADKGYNVVVVAREPVRLQTVADEVAAIRGGQKETSLAVSADVSDRAAVDEVASQVRSRFESLDAIIITAGYCATGEFLETPLEVWDGQMAVNVMGAVNVIHALLPEVVKAKGSVVIVNSFGGVMPLKNMSAYTASKYALAGFADSLALEMAAKGVHVGQVHPGIIKSDFLERAVFTGKDIDKARSAMDKIVNSSIAVPPSDVAAAVWKAFDRKKKEVLVGTAISAVISLYRTTGVNVTALSP